MLGLFTSAVSVYAQDTQSDNHTLTITVPEVAILDIEGGSSISLGYTAPVEAGLGVAGASNSDLWLNYSSIKSSINPTRTVSVKLSETVGGADIKLTTGAYSGSGSGTTGTVTGEITLSTTDQTIVSDIGSCYTGDGVNNGHNLTYKLDVGGTYADLEKLTTPVTVTYTISN